MRNLLAVALTVAAGCTPALQVVRPITGVPGVVRITLHQVHKDIFKFDVVNESPNTLVISRDAIVLCGPRGLQARTPGGFASTYTVPPGSVRRVNVRFDIKGFDAGEQLQVSFENALSWLPGPYGPPGIRPPIEPLAFVVH